MGKLINVVAVVLTVVVVGFIALVKPVYASEPVKKGHLVFACPTTETGKWAVVSEKDHKLQYMYGDDPKHAEIVVPANPKDQQDVHYAYITYSKGGALYIRFTRGEYHYVVFSGKGDGWEREEVVIFKGLEKIGTKKCIIPAQSNAVYDFDAYGNDDSKTGLDIVYGQ